MATTSRICVINGHPDPSPERLCHGLVAAYLEGAKEAGHETRAFHVGMLDFPALRTAVEFKDWTVPDTIREVQDAITWANHVVLVYPLWHGMLPAWLKAFLEQVFRPGFAMDTHERGWTGHLKGKSARIVVTMGMPGFVYKLYFMAHSLKALRRNILGFCGMKPVRSTVIGAVESASEDRRRGWLETMRDLGRHAR